MVELARAGKSRREVKEATGVGVHAITRIVREAGVEWGRVNAGGNGTPEVMAKARGYRSDYMRNRREAIADKLLDAAEKSADLALNESDPRRRQALMQSADASMRAYANVTKNDLVVSEQEQMRQSMSMLDKIMAQARTSGDQARATGDAIRRSGVTDPVLICGSDGKAEVGDYGWYPGDIGRDGQRVTEATATINGRSAEVEGVIER